MINGFPTSQYGVTYAQPCEWCHTAIEYFQDAVGKMVEHNTITNKNEHFRATNFCSTDCKEEYYDWKELVEMKKNMERMRLPHARALERIRYAKKKGQDINNKIYT